MRCKQLGFSDYKLTTAKKQTKREKFLSKMHMGLLHRRCHGGFEIGVDLCLHVCLKQSDSWGGFAAMGHKKDLSSIEKVAVTFNSA